MLTKEQKLSLLRRIKLMMICEKENKFNLNALSETFKQVVVGNKQAIDAVEFYENQIIERLDNVHKETCGHTMEFEIEEFEKTNSNSVIEKIEERVLKIELELAIQNEDYEKASKLRDLINLKQNL